MTRLKRFAFSALALMMSLLVAMVIGEIAVGIIAPQKTLFPRYVESDEYPVELPANSRLVASQGRLWNFVYTTNELGRRGAFIPKAERYDTVNAVFLGDSFTFGAGVQDGEVYTEVVSMILGPEYAVVNGGMGGWGIDSEIKWYYRVGREYQPRFVVLQFTANDPSDYRGVATVEEGGFAFYPYPGSKPWWQRFLSQSGLIQRSQLYALARAASDGRTRGGEGVTALETDNAMLQETYVELLRVFAEELHEAGIELLFLSVTALDRATSNYIYDVDRFPMIRDALTELAAAHRLRFVDLPLDEMRQHPGSPEGHQWSVRHHEIVGTRIAEVIRALDAP